MRIIDCCPPAVRKQPPPAAANPPGGRFFASAAIPSPLHFATVFPRLATIFHFFTKNDIQSP